MALGSRHLLLGRLYNGLDAVKALELERAAAEREYRQACGAVDNARIALESAESQRYIAELTLRSILARRDVVQGNNEQTRRILRTMTTLPSDVLSEIFKFACEPTTPFDTTPKAYDWNPDIEWDAVAQPCRLMAVCSAWRNVALDCGSIWSYIPVPHQIADDNGTDGRPGFSKYIEYFNFLIERSRGAPLHIVIRAKVWGNTLAIITRREEAFAATFEVVFPRLIQNANRIRTLSIRWDGCSPARDMQRTLISGTFDLLRCPTPQLEVANLYSGVSRLIEHAKRFLDPSVQMPQFLPHAPRLRTLKLHNFPILCRPPHAGLPELTTLTYGSSSSMPTSIDHLWSTLSLAPQLKHLKLDLQWRGSRPRLDRRWVPSLESLPISVLELETDTSEGLLFDSSVQLPNLTTLSISATEILHIDISQTMAHRLTSLSINDGHVWEAHVVVFRLLKAIERFKLDIRVTDVPAPPLEQDHFFSALCADHDPLWPKLRYIGILWRGKEEDAHGQSGLLKLVTARTQRHTDGSVAVADARAPCPIEEVEFDDQTVPLWEAVRLQSLLGEGCHRIVDE